MSKAFEFYTNREIRKILLKFLEDTKPEDLIAIPKHFNNNIWWNIAHVVVTQQLLLYKLSGLDLNIPAEIVSKYSKGSKPKEIPAENDISIIKKNLIELIDRTEEDYNNGVFTSYTSYTTSANVTLESIEDAIAFNNFHEGIHLGSILALRRALEIA